jgi:cell division protein FtsB
MPLRVPSFQRSLQVDIPRPGSFGQWLIFKAVPRFIVVVLVYLTIFGPSGMIRRHRMVADLEKVKRRLEDRQAENALLVRDIQLISNQSSLSEPDTAIAAPNIVLERKIAEDLLLVAPNSTIYRFPDKN